MNKLKKIKICIYILYVICICAWCCVLLIKNNIAIIAISSTIGVLSIIGYFILSSMKLKIEKKLKEQRLDEYKNQFALILEGKHTESPLLEFMYTIFNNKNEVLATLIKKQNLDIEVEFDKDNNLTLSVENRVTSYKDKKNLYNFEIEDYFICFNSNEINDKFYNELAKLNNLSVNSLNMKNFNELKEFFDINDLTSYLISDINLYKKNK